MENYGLSKQYTPKFSHIEKMLLLELIEDVRDIVEKTDGPNLERKKAT